MKHIFPNHYNEFHCIADRCTITCCQEWKITVDDDTNRKWKKILPPDTISDKRKNLTAYTCKKDGARVIGLDQNHRCPFLSQDKLCHLVTSYGDSVLSETCTLFPREIHEFSTHTEASLMPCCPAVIDLWCEKNIEFPTVSSIVDHSSPMFLVRDNLIKLLQNSDLSIEEALFEGFYILLELYKNQPVTISQINEYFSKQTLFELHSALADINVPADDTFTECNELLQDLAVNYSKEGLYTGFLQPILTEAEKYPKGTFLPDKPDDRLTDSGTGSELSGIWNLFCDMITDHDIVFRNFLSNELFSDLIIPGSSSKIIEHMVMQYQWIIMEYTTIRQSLFLWCSIDPKNPLTYETVRNYIVIISRMTGYDDDDIRTYLENSFAKLIWDWGYAALIIGA